MGPESPRRYKTRVRIRELTPWYSWRLYTWRRGAGGGAVDHGKRVKAARDGDRAGMSPAPHFSLLCDRAESWSRARLASNRRRLYSGSRGTRNRGLCVGAGRQAVLSGLVWAALAAQPATAADMSSLGIDTRPPPEPVIAPPALTFPGTYIDIVDEVRVGVFAHNWIHDESAPVDASVELLSSALPLPGPADNPWFGWFFRPRINIGGMINTGGKTSYAFTGLTWRFRSTKAVFFRGRVRRLRQQWP